MGVRKIKHMHTNFLWLQQGTAWGHLRLEAVQGTVHVTDLFTKCVPRPQLEKQLVMLNALLEYHFLDVLDFLDFLDFRVSRILFVEFLPNQRYVEGSSTFLL